MVQTLPPPKLSNYEVAKREVSSELGHAFSHEMADLESIFVESLYVEPLSSEPLRRAFDVNSSAGACQTSKVEKLFEYRRHPTIQSTGKRGPATHPSFRQAPDSKRPKKVSPRLWPGRLTLQGFPKLKKPGKLQASASMRFHIAAACLRASA